MRFNDEGHINNVLRHGKYPKIHDDIFHISKYVLADNVMDFGCSTGLLALRLSTRFENVVGVDASFVAVSKAIEKENVSYRGLKITEDTIDELKLMLVQNKITGLFARRIIPEIWETGGQELVNSLVDAFYNSGVEYIAVEGRKPVKNPKNVLHNVDKEIEVFKGKYRVVAVHKNCRVLRKIRGNN